MSPPPAPNSEHSSISLKTDKGFSCPFGEGMVWFVCLQVILHQLIHIVSPTSSRNKRHRRWNLGDQAFVTALARTAYSRKLICSYSIRGDDSKESKSGGEGKASRSHVRTCRWAEHLWWQLTNRFAGLCPRETYLLLWGRARRRHLSTYFHLSLAQHWLQRSFLPL